MVQVYFLGIVDILEHYTFKKRVENGLKVLQTWQSSAISAVDADTYAARFVAFVGTLLK